MPHHRKLWIPVVTLLFLASIPSCDNSNDVTEPSPEVVASVVQAAAPAAVGAAADTEVAGSTITGLMGLITTTSPAGKAVSAQAGDLPQVCPSVFKLPNGLTGTCTELEGGGASFVFGGTVPGPYGSVVVDGTLIATRTASQPATGSQWSVDFDATAKGSQGTATWSANGTITLDAEDAVIGYTFAFIHTLTPVGGSPTIVNVTVTPALYTFVVNGSGGHSVRFEVSRAAGTGTIHVDGFLAANITVAEGCVLVNFVNPDLEDFTVCEGSGR